jgi:2-C-methyl-D-erythritol 4-phosphate cytidylyltransferase
VWHPFTHLSYCRQPINIVRSEGSCYFDEQGNKIVNRNNYKAVQTPQVFKLSLLKKSYLQPYSQYFTDDASVAESAGEKINLVDGNVENIKITTPADLIFANALIQNPRY